MRARHMSPQLGTTIAIQRANVRRDRAVTEERTCCADCGKPLDPRQAVAIHVKLQAVTCYAGCA